MCEYTVGENFGPPGVRVLMGNADCASLTWVTHSQVICVSPAGMNSTLAFTFPMDPYGMAFN